MPKKRKDRKKKVEKKRPLDKDLKKVKGGSKDVFKTLGKASRYLGDIT